MIRRVATIAALLLAASALAQEPTPTPPPTLTEALHADSAGRLVQEFTLPGGMTISVEPDGILRFGGASGLSMSFGALSGQFEMNWPQGALTFNQGTGILDFNGTIRANAFQGPFEGTVTLADSESVVFSADQITTGTLSGDRLPWPGAGWESHLPTTNNPLAPYPANSPYFVYWISPDGGDIGEIDWRSASEIKTDMGMLTSSASLNWPPIAAGAESTLTLAVPGAATTGSPSVHLGWSAALPAGIILAQAWVSAANTVSIRLRNVSASTIDPPSLAVRATVHTP